MNPIAGLLLATTLLQAGPAADAGAPGEATVEPRAVAAKAEPPRPDGAIPLEVEARLQAMDEAVRKLQDATCIFYKREYKGELLPPEIIRLKIRSSPQSVYLKWLDEEYADREVIWREGWNDGDLRVHKGSFPDFTLNLSIDSRLAMSGSRHPVNFAGFAFTVQMLVRDFGLLNVRPECLVRFVDLGPQRVHDAPSRCVEAEMDKDRCPQLYGRRAHICIHDELSLPTRVLIWDFEDEALRLVEEYGYEAIQVDVGLGEADFDPDNPAYDF